MNTVCSCPPGLLLALSAAGRIHRGQMRPLGITKRPLVRDSHFSSLLLSLFLLRGPRFSVISNVRQKAQLESRVIRLSGPVCF